MKFNHKDLLAGKVSGTRAAATEMVKSIDVALQKNNLQTAALVVYEVMTRDAGLDFRALAQVAIDMFVDRGHNAFLKSKVGGVLKNCLVISIPPNNDQRRAPSFCLVIGGEALRHDLQRHANGAAKKAQANSQQTAGN